MQMEIPREQHYRLFLVNQLDNKIILIIPKKFQTPQINAGGKASRGFEARVSRKYL
jgi:hypothetical protein